MSRGADPPSSKEPAELTVRNQQRREPVNLLELRQFLKRASAVAPRGVRATVVLVGDTPMRAFNRRYKGQDRPTDVLSFAAPETPAEPGYLGDIVISVETARRQALRRGSTLSRELRVLALHGLIHLLGYDHENDHGEMRRLEYRWRRKLGITRPARKPTRR
jgi:probable rRNA maturation factor